MDIKRAILWMIFIFSVFMLWTNWQAYKNPPLPQQTQERSSNTPAAQTPNTSVPAVTSSGQEPTTPSTPSQQVASNSEKVQIKTNVLNATFDTVGAQLIDAKLILYHGTKQEAETQLLERDGNTYVAQSGLVTHTGKKFPDQNTPFKLISTETTLTGNGLLPVVFEAESDGIKVTRTFTFHQDSYRIDVQDTISNGSDQTQTFSQYYQITRNDYEPPGSSFFYQTFHGFALYSDSERFQKVAFSDIEKNDAKYVKQASDGWISFIQHFFVTAWIPQNGQERAIDVRKISADKMYAISATESPNTLDPGATLNKQATLWVGPQDQRDLTAIDPSLALVVDYGMLTVLAKPMFTFMTWLHSFIGNWGWTIVLLTVIIKLILYPLSAASYRSMAKMKNAAPRMQALKEKFGSDKQKLNAAMMEMYRAEKINPLGGCLPILIQIPIFLTLYRVILASVEMRGAPWLGWITDLSVHDPYFILPAIMTATMFLQFKLNPAPPDPMQARIMMIMPLVFGAMMFMFPSGLVLYWVVNNILSITQQQWITRRMNRAANEEILTHK